jgi:hypothetical protein
MNSSAEIKQVAAALVKTQHSLGAAVKDSDNPFFKKKYADLSSVWEACHQALQDNGLAVIQLSVPADPGFAALETIFLHTSGEWIAGIAVAPLAKNDPQAYGSAITYLRRYGMKAGIGVMDTDDDAEGAMNRSTDRTNASTTKSSPAGKVSTGPIETIPTAIEKVTQAKKLDGTIEYTIHAGEKYYTHNQALALKAKEMMAAGTICTLSYTTNSEGRTLLAITPPSA